VAFLYFPFVTLTGAKYLPHFASNCLIFFFTSLSWPPKSPQKVLAITSFYSWVKLPYWLASWFALSQSGSPYLHMTHCQLYIRATRYSPDCHPEVLIAVFTRTLWNLPFSVQPIPESWSTQLNISCNNLSIKILHMFYEHCLVCWAVLGSVVIIKD
jgi:hypothetical protein